MTDLALGLTLIFDAHGRKEKWWTSFIGTGGFILGWGLQLGQGKDWNADTAMVGLVGFDTSTILGMRIEGHSIRARVREREITLRSK
jgi:hypothetical protein